MKACHPLMLYAVGLVAFGACVHDAAATTQVVSSSLRQWPLLCKPGMRWYSIP